MPPSTCTGVLGRRERGAVSGSETMCRKASLMTRLHVQLLVLTKLSVTGSELVLSGITVDGGTRRGVPGRVHARAGRLAGHLDMQADRNGETGAHCSRRCFGIFPFAFQDLRRPETRPVTSDGRIRRTG